MTERMLSDYMANRTFYNIAASSVVDNPDQRLTSDINQFTSTSLSLAFTFLTSLVDLVSFSGILFSIYPPLFVALVVYAVGGTVASFFIGRVRSLQCHVTACHIGIGLACKLRALRQLCCCMQSVLCLPQVLHSVCPTVYASLRHCWQLSPKPPFAEASGAQF